MPNAVSNVKSRGALIAKDAAGFLSDTMQFVKTIDKQDPSIFKGMNGYSAGDTVRINVPTQFTVGTSANITSSIQDVVEGGIALTVNNQYNVPIAFTSQELATDEQYGRWREAVLKPAMIALSNQVEQACLQQAYQSVSSLVGTFGSTTFDTDTVLQAGERITTRGCADFDNRFVLLNPAATRSAVNARKGQFQSSDEISKQYKSGAMGMADGFTFLQNNLLPTHTNGTATGSLTVNGGGQTGATINLTGTGTQTITAGTVFTIAGVFAVHPVTKATLSNLQQFVVTANATAVAGAYTAVAISPSIVTSGATQTVSAGPAAGAAVTIVGSASAAATQNLAFHKSAFRFVSLPLIQPEGVNMVGQETSNGITVRVVEAYDILQDRMILRADLLWGMANVRPEWACRLTA